MLYAFNPLVVAAVLSLLLASCSSAPEAPEAQASNVNVATKSPIRSSIVGSWRDDFNALDTTRWALSNSGWKPFWAKDGLNGTWNPANVTVSGGYLVMKLDVTPGLVASAAELATHAKYGYGRYEARLRAASSSANPAVRGHGVSGNITAFFNFVNDSQTEIDHEIEGQNRTTDWIGTWQTTNRHDYGTGGTGTDLSQDFHTYRWDWAPTKVDFYIDGVLKRTITSVVPATEAHLMFNLWPTNSTLWGGKSTAGTQYMLVDYVSFTPSH
ncbi:glycoside hydrolase family 16 protein [Deinococcus deserti]|uniref:Putative licheninase n=1 Tax=Deinococcus deserti (strain DSM 17065 / CIP 109153 / LMG 22923 / VCD115) TaxID=546414 RepID=C1D2C0_DEIDV|nr:putative licheninase [Deinococcus deserti VCD115]